jgi:acetolactate synthase small subunit
MKPRTIQINTLNQPVLVGRFMLIFSRRKVDVTNFSFKKLNEEDGQIVIEFNSDDLMAQNLEKQLNKQIDIYEATLIH